eukprot:TRINITY_DN3177_c0_g1_i1.p1 TRINITY_DN3177_c0_g1~~TRINITY_DN3177_c0_g1_i1.p1  ORF type:complete len:290 (+),score=29.98 TRINITY_DN3177_c0_g1_i1:519-1388(+)
MEYVEQKKYMAPEVLANKSYGKPIDIWSTGVLTYQLLMNKHPASRNGILLSNEWLYGDIAEQACSFIKKLTKIKSRRNGRVPLSTVERLHSMIMKEKFQNLGKLAIFFAALKMKNGEKMKESNEQSPQKIEDESFVLEEKLKESFFKRMKKQRTKSNILLLKRLPALSSQKRIFGLSPIRKASKFNLLAPIKSKEKGNIPPRELNQTFYCQKDFQHFLLKKESLDQVQSEKHQNLICLLQLSPKKKETFLQLLLTFVEKAQKEFPLNCCQNLQPKVKLDQSQFKLLPKM